MTEIEAIEIFKRMKSIIKRNEEKHFREEYEAVEMAIAALNGMHEITARNFNLGTIKEYMKFEDSLVKNGWTLKSVLEAREKQVALKPNVVQGVKSFGRNIYECRICGTRYSCYSDQISYCYECGQKLDWPDWEENNDSD